jgi:hypothetical protein
MLNVSSATISATFKSTAQCPEVVVTVAGMKYSNAVFT